MVLARLNFFKAQKPILIVLKFFGCLPYRLHSETFTVENNKSSFFYSISANFLFQALFIFAHFTMLKEVSNFLQDNNEATTYTTIFEGYFMAFVFNVISLCIIFKKKSQVKIITLIIELEKEVSDIKSCPLDYNEKLRKSSLRFFICQITFTVIILVYYALTLIPEFENLYQYFELFSFNMYVIVIVFITCFMENLVKTIGNLFDALNLSLSHYVTICPFHFYNREVQKVFELHNRLVQCIEFFNETFGSIAVGIFNFILGAVTFEVYYASAQVFVTTGNPMNIRQCFDLLLNMSQNISVVVIFAKFGFTCESVQKKASVK